MPQHSIVEGMDVLAATPVVTLAGALDPAALRELSVVLIGLLSMGHGEVEIDLSRVASLDPTVPEVFADLWTRGLVLRLVNPSPAAQELLHLEASPSVR